LSRHEIDQAWVGADILIESSGSCSIVGRQRNTRSLKRERHHADFLHAVRNRFQQESPFLLSQIGLDAWTPDSPGQPIPAGVAFYLEKRLYYLLKW
jgi:hypothetical protein